MSTTTATTRTVLRAEGFSCPSCVTTIERRLGRLDGVTAVAVRFASARIEVEHDPQRVSVDDLVAAVASVGYAARPA
ncbi:Heavy metal transport/detoxification protein [Cellulomonas flavigena DSM 20109]|uniref:Copper chaperone CopZ n=1 Tax=Cellulomonas flavigena (strain ATCC 482 / DSM 20109 / BCRC 11376 / JCM 18109 / NBRC 3775 / NCIMB 8073 / NRS 134) TaxID=446466 RepID=D5UJA9_CELFN|nr:heavy-metal-associated domain-containing protein [Cellulomonas flavigena]ADG73632.1 Heavy metal transport/detoxification protein [Cellulomonas flavigena DSM 20109]